MVAFERSLERGLCWHLEEVESHPQETDSKHKGPGENPPAVTEKQPGESLPGAEVGVGAELLAPCW